MIRDPVVEELIRKLNSLEDEVRKLRTQQINYVSRLGVGVVAPAGVGGVAVNGDIYTVAWTNYSAISTIVGWSSFTSKEIFYKRVGKLLFVKFRLEGTSDATTASFTLPNNNNSNMAVDELNMLVQDNGVWQSAPGYINLAASNNVVGLYKNITSFAWTNSGTKKAVGSFCYEIA